MGIKLTSNQIKAVEMKLAGSTYTQIGLALGLTRQRAQQLIKPNKWTCGEVRRLAESKCARCRQLIESPRDGHIHHASTENKDAKTYNQIENLEYLCLSCHRLLHTQGPTARKVARACKCLRCGHEWHSVANPQPIVCPKCRSPYWDRERRVPKPKP